MTTLKEEKEIENDKLKENIKILVEEIKHSIKDNDLINTKN